MQSRRNEVCTNAHGQLRGQRHISKSAAIRCAIVIAFVWLFVINLCAFDTLLTTNAESQMADQQLMDIQTKEYETAVSIRYHKSDSYIEQIAREDFSMHRIGYTIILASSAVESAVLTKQTAQTNSFSRIFVLLYQDTSQQYACIRANIATFFSKYFHY